ncbi:MAG: Ger(x)C family spore germination protein [Bacillus sp. (in: Bacteria)]|nr:Ger(x)C family spore germination protein [Bacillus sp. (in: firmicutes)]
MKKHKFLKNGMQLGSIFFLTCFVLLTGCWSSHEASDLAILNVMSIDKNEAGQYELTALIANYQSSSSTMGSSQNQQYLPWIETGKGKSLLEALSKLASSTSKKMYLGHVQVVVFGERAAREGMEESIDWLRREGGFRPNMQLLVTKGKASDIIKTRTQLDTPLGTEIQNLIKMKRLSATNTVHNLNNFSESLMARMDDAITGEISFAREKGIQVVDEVTGIEKAGKEEKQKPKSDALAIQGTAVFKKANLKGWLNKQETRGVLWVTGNLKNDVIVFNCPRNDSGTISIKVVKTDSILAPHLVSGKTEIDVNIQVEGEIGEITCQGVKNNSKQIDELNSQLQEVVMQDVSLTFAKAKQDWQTDIFGFGKSIYRKYPEEWKGISPKWRDGGLRDLVVHVKVSANISRFGQSKNLSIWKE